MKQTGMHIRNVTALSALITLACMATPSKAQSSPAQSNSAAMSAQGSDTTRAELARFDQFLDSHPEIAEQLRKDPSLVNNSQFAKNHPALQTYLQDHPGIREELKENPNAFMRREDNFDRREGDRDRDRDVNRTQLARFNEFLESHREIAEQVRKNPKLLDNESFVENHPALMSYLREHPEVREQLKQNPNAFMQQENNFDRREDARDRDTEPNRAERAKFDRFLDDHREIGEQVRKNPSLINNDDFQKSHPVLQSYLQDHPAIRDEARENPGTFTRTDDRDRYSRFENGDGRDDGRDMDRDHSHDMDRDRTDRDRADRTDHDRSANFREFLGSHTEVAQKLSHDPSLAKNQEFVKNHPDFQQYLKSHPEVNRELMNNPEGFVRSSQPESFKTNDQGFKNPTSPAYDPKVGH